MDYQGKIKEQKKEEKVKPFTFSYSNSQLHLTSTRPHRYVDQEHFPTCSVVLWSNGAEHWFCHTLNEFGANLMCHPSCITIKIQLSSSVAGQFYGIKM